MIFGTWRSYFISWQIFENKVWCPVSKKRRRYFYFLLSFAYPIDRLDWALFSVVILFHHWFPLLEKVEIRAFILPRNLPAILIIFTGRGGASIPDLYVMNSVMTHVVKSRFYFKIKIFHEYFFSVQEKLLWLFKLYDKVRDNSCFCQSRLLGRIY